MESPFIKARGASFERDGVRFPVNGVNCYFLAYCSDMSRRAALATARQMGANVIRSWAFLMLKDLSPEHAGFQSLRDGGIVVNDGPTGLQRLDMLIKAAEDLDIKLILPLVNHWQALGGMPTYANWLENSSDVTSFYRSPLIRTAYREWVRTILTRRNTITGRWYYEEPSILAWELTNEARCPVPGGRELLTGWISEMAAFVKSLDSNHLLALGDEGFFYRKGKGHLYDGGYGVDWEANLSDPNMDFGTYHFYPQDWGFGGNLNFADKWIRDHAKAAERLNKPALMEEYGLRLGVSDVHNAGDRKSWFQRWHQTVDATGSAGSLLWMLGQRNTGEITDTGGYVDDYVVYGPSDVYIPG